MATKKFTQLPAIATNDIEGNEIIALSDDPSGAPISKKATLDQLKNFINLPAHETYTTGWVANSDWTNLEITVNHAFGVNMTDLLVDFYISTDGTEAAAQKIGYYSEINAASVTTGVNVIAIDTNNIKIQTGVGGVNRLIDGTGVNQRVHNQSYYYKVDVIKIDSIDLSNAYNGYYNTPGWISNSDWTNWQLAVTHNLNADIEDLNVDLFLSPNSDGSSARLITFHGADSATDKGVQIYGNNSNNINLESGSAGIVTIVTPGTGNFDTLTTQTWYYKVVVTKKQLDLLPTLDVNTVHSNYEDNSGQSIPDTTETTITWNTQVSSNNISYSGGTFTINESGYYQINAMITYVSGIYAAGDVFDIRINKNASNYAVLERKYTESTITQAVQVGRSIMIYFDATDTMSITGRQITGGAVVLASNAQFNKVQIIKVPDNFVATDSEPLISGQDFSLAASSQSYDANLLNGMSIGQKFRVSWTGGFGTYFFTFTNASGKTLNNIALSEWKGHCQGYLDIMKIANNTFEAINADDIWDKDIGNFATGRFEKSLSGRMRQYGSISETTTTLIANKFGSTAGNLYYVDDVVNFPISYAAVPTIAYSSVSSGAGAEWNNVTTTQLDTRVFHVSNSTSVNYHYTSDGLWTTSYPRKIGA